MIEYYKRFYEVRCCVCERAVPSQTAMIFVEAPSLIYCADCAMARKVELQKQTTY
jgi:ribosomal protein S27E